MGGVLLPWWQRRYGAFQDDEMYDKAGWLAEIARMASADRQMAAYVKCLIRQVFNPLRA